MIVKYEHTAAKPEMVELSTLDKSPLTIRPKMSVQAATSSPLHHGRGRLKAQFLISHDGDQMSSTQTRNGSIKVLPGKLAINSLWEHSRRSVPPGGSGLQQSSYLGLLFALIQLALRFQELNKGIPDLASHF